MEGYTKNLNLNPVILGVRCCSTYHPDYNKLLAIHGQNSIREITNGFALKCMTYLLKLLMENGYTVKDVQSAMGFENPQAIYKWISGRSLPSLDNFVILSRLLHTSIEDILVVDGDIIRLMGIYFKLPVQ